MESSQMFNSRDRDTTRRGFEEIVGNSQELERVLEEVQYVAPTDSTVLIEGETGTGKELIAHAIHNSSSRHGRPFVSGSRYLQPLQNGPPDQIRRSVCVTYR